MSVTDETLDKVADVATEVIGNAAGAVADPKTAISKAKTASLRVAPILVAMLAVIAIALIRRRSGPS